MESGGYSYIFDNFKEEKKFKICITQCTTNILSLFQLVCTVPLPLMLIYFGIDYQQ